MAGTLQNNQFSGNALGVSDYPELPGNNRMQGSGGSFWDTLTGQTAYSAPEQVFDPMAAHDMSNYNNMSNASDYYQGLMTGSKPSLAESQMKQGIAQANQNAMQAASGSSGVNRAMAFRNAQNNASNAAAQGAIAGGQQRLQEQQLGAQGYAQTLQGRENMQNQVLGLQNQSQANLNNQYATNAQIAQANAKNESGSVGGMMAMGGAALAALSDEAAKTDVKSLLPGVTVDAMPAIDQLPAAQSSSPADSGGGTGGGFMSMGTSMLSDIKTKNVAKASQTPQNVGGSGAGFYDLANMINQKSAAATPTAPAETPDYSSGFVSGSDVGPSDTFFSDKESKEALDPVKPYSFDYKDKFAHELGMEAAKNAYLQAFMDAKKPRVGVMAQDLQKSPEGKEIVMPNPDGMEVNGRQALAIDGKRAIGFLLANQADLNGRLKGLERRA